MLFSTQNLIPFVLSISSSLPLASALRLAAPGTYPTTIQPLAFSATSWHGNESGAIPSGARLFMRMNPDQDVYCATGIREYYADNGGTSDATPKYKWSNCVYPDSLQGSSVSVKGGISATSVVDTTGQVSVTHLFYWVDGFLRDSVMAGVTGAWQSGSLAVQVENPGRSVSSTSHNSRGSWQSSVFYFSGPTLKERRNSYNSKTEPWREFVIAAVDFPTADATIASFSGVDNDGTAFKRVTVVNPQTKRTREWVWNSVGGQWSENADNTVGTVGAISTVRLWGGKTDTTARAFLAPTAGTMYESSLNNGGNWSQGGELTADVLGTSSIVATAQVKSGKVFMHVFYLNTAGNLSHLNYRPGGWSKDGALVI